MMLLQQTATEVSGYAGWGLGGLAGVIFYFYRQDRKDSEDRLGKLGTEFREVVERNTEALTKLTTQLEKN